MESNQIVLLLLAVGGVVLVFWRLTAPTIQNTATAAQTKTEGYATRQKHVPPRSSMDLGVMAGLPIWCNPPINILGVLFCKAGKSESSAESRLYDDQRKGEDGH